MDWSAYSECEQLLIKAFDLVDYASRPDVYPVTLYREMIVKCAVENRKGPEAQAAVAGFNMLAAGKPYRGTEEFDKALNFPLEESSDLVRRVHSCRELLEEEFTRLQMEVCRKMREKYDKCVLEIQPSFEHRRNVTFVVEHGCFFNRDTGEEYEWDFDLPLDVAMFRLVDLADTHSWVR